MSKLSEIVKIVENGQNCQQSLTLLKITKIVKNCQNCQNSQKLSKMPKLSKIDKSYQNSLKLSKLLSFLATLVALHFTPVSKSVSKSVGRVSD